MFGLKMKKGFTLAELLIVVAIIGVLVAVAIPIFSRNLERAREATCKANRRSLYSQVIAEHILSDRPCSELFNEFVANAGKCPSGGAFSWEDSGNAGKINCDYHDDSGSSDSGSSSIPPLQPTADLSRGFDYGTVIQDENGIWVVTTASWLAWKEYNKGEKTIEELIGFENFNAKRIEHPSDIKDSSSTEIAKGDLYYDSIENKYYYVTVVNPYEAWPQGEWITLAP